MGRGRFELPSATPEAAILTKLDDHPAHFDGRQRSSTPAAQGYNGALIMSGLLRFFKTAKVVLRPDRSEAVFFNR